MAEKGKIGGKIVLDGEKEYREALKNIKTEHSQLRSEMKLCNSTFAESQNSIEALTQKHDILQRRLESQKEKVQVCEKAIADYSEKHTLAAEKIETLNEALNQAKEEQERMKASSDTSGDALEEQAKKVEELEKQLNLAKESYSVAEQKTKSWQTSLNYANAELNQTQAELNQTARYMEEARQSTNQCATSIDQYGKEVKEASDQTNVFGDVLKANLVADVISAGVKKLADGIRDVATSSTEVGMSFEASMSQVAATMGMTAEEINAGSADYEKLSAAAKKCGAETKYSASEAADALNYLELAGYSVDKSVETLPKVLDLAAAGGMDLAYSSDLVTDSMAALNLQTKDLDNYIDEMARTSQKSNTSVAQLGEATLVCAGTVTLTKQSLETMNAELGVLANNGIKGAEGGTHLRNILLSLTSPTSSAEEALAELNIQVSDADGNIRDLNDVMVDMNASMAEMSSTEKTQMISRIFNKTDIAAVNALLKGTGDEYNNLKAELEQCSGAAKNMADTMNNNLKGKVTILKSALEGLGIAAYEVFDDDMKKAVDGATSAVDSLQRSITRGNLGVSLNKLSSAMGDFCENAIDVGEDALPVVIDGMAWILDNADLVASGVVGITAAHAEMTVAAPIIEATAKAWKAYKLENEGATVSQWLLNSAMNANPAGILITAITGLTAAVAAYCIINKDSLVVQSEEVQQTKELIEDTKALNAEFEKGVANRKQTSADLAAQQTTAQKLTAELGELRNKTNLTATEQTRMKMVVAELNKLMPELNLQYDDQNHTLSKTQEELEGCVEAYMALYKAQAAQEELQEIAEKQVEYEKQLYEIEEQRKDLQAELTAAQENYNAVMEQAKSSYGEMTELYGTMGMTEQQALENAKSALEELDATAQQTKDNNAALTDEYEYWLGVIGDNQAIYDAATAEDTLTESTLSTTDAMSDMATETAAAYQEMYDAVSNAVNNQLSIFSQFKEETRLTTDELLSNMQSQVDGISSWADNLEELGERGINQGLLQHLAEMGPEGAAYVATFVSMTDEELKKAGDLFAEAMSLPEETTKQIMDAWQEAGKHASEGLVLGIHDRDIDVYGNVQKLGEESLETLDETWDINSPSKETEQRGMYFTAGIEGGINSGKQSLLDTISNVCAEAVLVTQTAFDVNKMTAIGKQIPAGLEAGIRAGKSGVVKAVEEMCTEAVNKAESALDIHSPSKKFEWMGEMSGEGYTVGWEKSMDNIDRVIMETLPDPVKYLDNTPAKSVESSGKSYAISQEINIYSMADDPIEEAKKFKDAQREAAMAW